jgi:murein DD-endopeptidase / murein LD-carboxypeptidase
MAGNVNRHPGGGRDRCDVALDITAAPASAGATGDCVTRARSLIGTRFRLHGRDPATGLDCVGLIVCAYPAILRPPEGYGLRGGTAAGFAAMFIANGMTQRQGAPCIGDVLLLQPSSAQFHLGVWSGEGLIHADAVLRRVVETPGAPAWPLVSGWYFHKS